MDLASFSGGICPFDALYDRTQNDAVGLGYFALFVIPANGKEVVAVIFKKIDGFRKSVIELLLGFMLGKQLAVRDYSERMPVNGRALDFDIQRTKRGWVAMLGTVLHSQVQPVNL